MAKKKHNKTAKDYRLNLYFALSVLATAVSLKHFIQTPYISLLIGTLVFLLLLMSGHWYCRFQTQKRKQQYRASMLSDIDHLSGKSFEEYLKVYFEDRGYKARLTPDTNDYGADLIMLKDGQRTVVQAKRYKGQVGIAAIQQVIGAKEYYDADKAMVCTNSYFSHSAKELAKSAHVELWDRNKLFNTKHNI